MKRAGFFDEVFSDLVDLFRRAVDAAAYRALEDRGIDEGRLRMGVGRRRAARFVLDQHDLHALARDVRQGLIEYHRHLAWNRFAGRRRGDRERCEGNGYEKSGKHGNSPWCVCVV
ncbi:hypothetical protein D3C80_1493570 [compost metagenome]